MFSLRNTRWKSLSPVFILASALFFSAGSHAQHNDSISLKKYNKLYYRDSTAIVQHDTVIPADTSIVKIKKRKLVGFYYRYMFISNEDSLRNKMRRDVTAYEGKVVGNIQIVGLEPFGTSVEDTSIARKDPVTNAVNTMHMLTRKRIIKKNLLFEEGQALGAISLEESERLLRSLDYIYDVRITAAPVTENSDTVNVLVIVKDVFSIVPGFGITRDNDIELSLSENNMLGLGHRFYNNLILSTEIRAGYEGIYSIPSIFGTYMLAQVQYANTADSVLAGAKAERNFVSPDIRNAGGMSYYYRKLKLYSIYDEERGARLDIAYHTADAWYGRSFLVKTQHAIFKNRTSLAASGRIEAKYFVERPPGIEDTARELQNSFLSIAKLSYSRAAFQKDILVAGFGVTEDIPIGHLFEVTGGYEYGEVVNRYYAGLSLSHGHAFPRAGYFYNKFSIGSYFNQRAVEDGAIRLSAIYYSRLISQSKRFKHRLFARILYVRGINRTGINDRIDLYDTNTLRGSKSFMISGNTVFGTGLTFSMYSPWYLIGFRVALYAFTDVTYFGEQDEIVFNNRPNWVMGAGIRLNNEKFLFGTINIGINFYPAPAGDLSVVGATLQLNPAFPLPGFGGTKPDVVEYAKDDKVYYYE